jgi:hypothetical protein
MAKRVELSFAIDAEKTCDKSFEYFIELVSQRRM